MAKALSLIVESYLPNSNLWQGRTVALGECNGIIYKSLYGQDGIYIYILGLTHNDR